MLILLVDDGCTRLAMALRGPKDGHCCGWCKGLSDTMATPGYLDLLRLLRLLHHWFRESSLSSPVICPCCWSVRIDIDSRLLGNILRYAKTALNDSGRRLTKHAVIVQNIFGQASYTTNVSHYLLVKNIVW